MSIAAVHRRGVRPHRCALRRSDVVCTPAGDARMNFFTGLRCRMCGASFPAEALFVCDQCLGPARGDLRLRRDPRAPSRRPTSRHVRRISGATASCCRLRASRSPGSTRDARRSSAPTGSRGGSACPSCTSRTTRSTIRRSPTRIASSRSRRRARWSWASACSRARRPATSPTACRRTRRGSGSSATCSSPTTSSRRRCSAPPSTGRTSSPSPATTTT